MPRYYFHVSAPGREQFRDPEGQEFDDLTAAYDEAIASARSLMTGLRLIGKTADGHSFEIADVEGKVVLLVPFKSALPD